MYITVIATKVITTQSDKVSGYNLKSTNVEIIENIWGNDKIKVDGEIKPEYYNEYNTIDDDSNFINGFEYPVESIYIDVEKPENSYLQVYNKHNELVTFDLLCRRGTIYSVNGQGNQIEKEINFDSAYLTDINIGDTKVYMKDSELKYYKSIYSIPNSPDQFIEVDNEAKKTNNNECINRAIEVSNKNKKYIKESIKDFYKTKLFRHGSLFLSLILMLFRTTVLTNSSTIISTACTIITTIMIIITIVIFNRTGRLEGESWNEHVSKDESNLEYYKNHIQLLRK